MSVNKQEYLKRYLENKDSGKKRKKKSKTSVSRLKIVDENIDLKYINFGEKADEDEDEAPVIAEIIDERPLEVKLKEQYESSRWKKIDSNENTQRHPSATGEISLFENRDSDLRKTRHDSDSDISPHRHQRVSRNRHDSDSDVSPPRNSKQNSNKKHNSDSDISPPRTSRRNTSKRKNYDSDISPPRHRTNSATKKRHSSSDMSPPRYNKTKSNKLQSSSSQRDKNRIYIKNEDSDSDLSPPRAKSSNKSIEKSMKPGKTLSGLKAGLQNSETLKKETQELRKREKAHINMLDDDVSGRNADTIVRDRKTGLKRDLQQEKKMKDEENKKTEEHQQKYALWGKGIEQEQSKMNKAAEDIYETSKPLQRYSDDKDLDDRLKSIVHDHDDPMASYIRKKKQKNTPNVPAYSGPPAPPNRFNIPPGYRWDGVDRSNGFEKRYFQNINKKKAVEQDAYLWSIQDM